MKVDIYITTKFSGNFAKGKGSYGILLQVMRKNEPVTREHYAGWEDITCQKLNARAAAEAINYMTLPCDVVIHTDSQYIQYVVENGNTQGKYPAIWLNFFAARNRMKSVRVERESEHEYSSYLRRELDKGEYTVIKDR